METEVYCHRLIAAELKNKKILPFVTTIKARSLEDFKSWSQHSGEEFLYVLKGEICFQTEHYEPAVLGVGDSIYINSNMPSSTSPGSRMLPCASRALAAHTPA